jgi:hypothetical protein
MGNIISNMPNKMKRKRTSKSGGNRISDEVNILNLIFGLDIYLLQVMKEKGTKI